VTQNPEWSRRSEGEQPAAAGHPAGEPTGTEEPGAAEPGAGRGPGEGAHAPQESAGTTGAQPGPGEGGPIEDEVVEGEVVEPSGSAAAEADALLAEALDADTIEAEFSAAEAEARAATRTGASAEQVAALTVDLQRVHAEYSNYRKRVERDRELVRERAVEAVLVQFLPILDDIGRARDHEELVGGFRSVGEALEATVAKLGLTAFGVVGEPFDPTRHEALMREDREGVTEPTVATVLQIGYEMNGRIVRPARVSVAGAD